MPLLLLLGLLLDRAVLKVTIVRLDLLVVA
jgi:hypothetical protein